MLEKIVKILIEKGYQDLHIKISVYNDIGESKQKLEEHRDRLRKKKINTAFVDYELKLLELRGTEEIRCIYLSLQDDLSKNIDNPEDFLPFLTDNFNPEITFDLGKERIIYSFRPNNHSVDKIISKKKLMELIKSFPTYEEAVKLF